MNKKKHAAIAAAAAMLIPSAAAVANEQHVGGGCWQFGWDRYGAFWKNTKGYSRYWHPSKYHGSTVTSSDGGYAREDKGPNDWSEAILWNRSGYQYYYNYC